MGGKEINPCLQKELLSEGELDGSLVLLPQLLWSFAAHCKVTRGREEKGSLWMGRGTLRTNRDPDVMADNINPCWFAEGIFFFPREVGSGERMRKVMAFWQQGDASGQEWLSCKH